MEPTNVFVKSQRLLTNDVDFEKRMKPSAVLNVFQEIASAHAEQLDAGFDAMADRGLYWVLSRIRFEIVNCPMYEQEIVTETWPLQTNGAFFERDYRMMDASGQALIAASSVWCVLDRNTHAVIPARGLNLLPEIAYRSERALDCKIGKLPQPENGSKRTAGRKILPGDLDFNYHVNNTRYADFIFDCFDLEYLTEHTVRALQIHYLQEGKCGADLRLSIAPYRENAFTVAGQVENRPLFAATVEFN